MIIYVQIIATWAPTKVRELEGKWDLLGKSRLVKHDNLARYDSLDSLDLFVFVGDFLRIVP